MEFSALKGESNSGIGKRHLKILFFVNYDVKSPWLYEPTSYNLIILEAQLGKKAALASFRLEGLRVCPTRVA